jgi:aspartyl-tRNA synthetase
MAKYGSDKPDLRFGLQIQDFGPLFAQSPFGIFREAVEHGGTIRGFVIPAPRSIRAAKSTSSSSWRNKPARPASSTRATPPKACRCRRSQSAKKGARKVLEASARRRKTCSCSRPARPTPRRSARPAALAGCEEENLIPEGKWELTWVTDFPLFDWNADEKRWDSVNHPFTAPREEDLHMLESDPGKVLAKAYDVILNGWELGGGSIRIHDRETQAKVFSLLGMSDEDAKNRFGFFLESLEYGTPPHGGLALGLDRICALLAGETSIREVIPFPKTTQAVDLMCDAPSTVDPRQLRELHIKPI